MAARRSKFASIVLAVALLLSAGAPASADDKGGGGDSTGSYEKKKKGRPSSRVQGHYVIRIAGYYSGTGTARASGDGIKISARVKDPANNEYAFQAKQLEIVEDRFSGTGLLEGVELRIDGRLDPKDGSGNEVLKKGRMTFTFSVNGHHSRGAGDLRQSN